MHQLEYDQLPEHLLLYDGECGLCDHAVQFLLNHDTHKSLHYSPLQGEIAKQILSKNPHLQKLDSIIYVRLYHKKTSFSSTKNLQDKSHTLPKIQIFWHSSAVIEISKELPFPWNLIVVFRIIPTFLLDKAYLFIARHRLRFFGKVEQCRLPTASERSRFL